MVSQEKLDKLSENFSAKEFYEFYQSLTLMEKAYFHWRIFLFRAKEFLGLIKYW